MDSAGVYHVVSIPFPGRGHVNPMMSLCRLIAARGGDGLLLTVVVTEDWRDILASGAPWPANLRFRAVGNVLPLERTRGSELSVFYDAVFTKMEGPVEEAIGGMDPPADFVLADSLLRWAAAIAGRRGIPVTSVWTESAKVFLAAYGFGKMEEDGRLPPELGGEGNEILAYLPRVSSSHFIGPVSDPSSILSRFLSRFSWFTTSQSLIFTSFYELESHSIDILRSHLSIPIYTPGPCIPHTTNNNSSPYLEWLDTNPSNSVIFVSLGSFIPISTSQMEEIMQGLLSSCVKFLWAVRGNDNDSDNDDSNFMGDGLVVTWCDQLEVLCHPSVGGFLTHCGWNSTLEGVFAGVPMLTFPLIWDQFPNSKMIVEDWKIGRRLKEEGVEVVGREEVGRMVRELMGEEGKEMRRRAEGMKERCGRALMEGGSSSLDIDAFLRDMMMACKK